MNRKQKVVFVGDGSTILRLLKEENIKKSVNPVAIYADSIREKNFSDTRIRPTTLINCQDEIDTIECLDPDYLFSVGNFDVIVSRAVISLMNGNAVNIHYGLLPMYAGRHGYQWAIRNGEAQTGVTLHSMTHPFDSGKVIATSVFDIATNDTGLSVYKKCVTAGRKLARRFLINPNPAKCSVGEVQVQSLREVYYSSDIGNGEINFEMSIGQICNFIRAADFRPFRSPSYTPWYRDKLGREWEVYSCRAITLEDFNAAESVGGRVEQCRDGFVAFDDVREKAL